jgi:hypothetical protein
MLFPPFGRGAGDADQDVLMRAMNKEYGWLAAQRVHER